MASRKTQQQLAKGRKQAEVSEPEERGAVTHTVEPEVAERRADDILRHLAQVTERRDAREERAVAALERIAAAMEAQQAPQEVVVSPNVEVVRRGMPPPAAQPDTPQGDVKPEPAKSKKPDLKAAQQAFLAKLATSRTHAVAALKEFGVERVSQLPADKYPEFIAKLEG